MLKILHLLRLYFALKRKYLILNFIIFSFFLMSNVSFVQAQTVSPVPEGAKVEYLAGGIRFAEGPLWHPDEFLLISDIDGNRIYKIDPQAGTKEVYLYPSGGSNGLSFDNGGYLIMCQRDKRSLSRLEPDNSVTILVSHYDGKKFNSPNDLSVRSDGTIFFTDPYFDGMSPAPRELSFNGIYCLKSEGDLMLLDKSIGTPNGICQSPDEKKLYVNDSFNLAIYVFDIGDDLTLTNKRIFAQMSGSGYGDGMKVDENGLLYSTGPGGIWIFSPDGKLVDKINVPGNASNLNWGDADYQTLYITNWNNVYKIRLNTRGITSVAEQKDISVPYYFDLLQNYPNPFNPETTLEYKLPQTGLVRLEVYNMLGQRIKTLIDQNQVAGVHRVAWDGKNELGEKMASGIYFYRMETNGFKATKRMLLTR